MSNGIEGITVDNWITFLGLLIAGGSSLSGAIAYLVGRDEAAKKEVMGELGKVDGKRSSDVQELHRRIDDVRKDSAELRENIPQKYATIEAMRDVEARIMNGLTATESRMSARFDRIEAKLDGIHDERR